MSLGQTLRAAREAKGITTSELAARTHLLVQIVEGLENEDFRRIPAPIYGRGFIKLYCEVVGLDPKPLQAEFTALYAQGKEPSQRIGQAVPPPPPPPPPQPKAAPSESIAEPVPPKVDIPVAEEKPTPLFAEEPPPKVFDVLSAAKPEPMQEPAEAIMPAPPPEPAPVAETAPVIPEPMPLAEPDPVLPGAVTPSAPETPKQEPLHEQTPRRSYGELFEQTYAQPEPTKPSAAERFRDTMSNVSHGVFANVQKLPPNTGRMVVVAGAAIALLVLVAWGVTALYKATTPQDNPPKPTAKEEVNSAPKENSAKPVAYKEEAKPEVKKEAAKPAARKPGELKSSGIQIPALYID